MTDDPKQQQDNPVTQQDERLAKELESLYRRVASLDSTEAASDIAENTDLCYKILQIHPDVSLSDIHLAYKRMTGAWDPERYPQVPSWKETSTKKLKEIETAYQKILLLHASRGTADPGDATRTPPSTALLSFPINSDPEETAPVRENVNGLSGLEFKLLPWLFVPGALIAFILLLVFLWPTLYYYDTVRLGDEDYPLRINRLTTHAQYYDGQQWLEPPLHVETPRNVTPGMAVPPLPVEPAGVGSLSKSKPAPPPPAKNISPQAAPFPLPAGPAGVGSRSESKPAPPPPATQKITPPGQISVKTKIGAPYSIQVSAYPAKYKADVLAEEMRAKKFAVRVDAVFIQGKGQWYRVLLGQFENRDAALRYLKDHRIGETYPGSFIQRAVIHSK